MATSYTTFSFVVPLDTDEEREWASDALAFLAAFANSDGERCCIHCGAALERALALVGVDDGTLVAVHDGEGDDCDRHELNVLDAILPEFGEGGCVGYEAEVDADGLWIHSDGSGTPEDVVPLLQAFLARFAPEGAMGFTWADSCSRPLLGEFGGGAVFVTATTAEWMTSWQWLSDKAHQFGPERVRAA